MGRKPWEKNEGAVTERTVRCRVWADGSVRLVGIHDPLAEVFSFNETLDMRVAGILREWLLGLPDA
jgi:hypothetical protein